MKLLDALRDAQDRYVRRASWPMSEPSMRRARSTKGDAIAGRFEDAYGRVIGYDNETMHADDWEVVREVVSERRDVPDVGGGLARPAEIEKVDHPAHYGGDTTYEAIKVIEAWELGFCLGNTVKYISRAGKKGDALEDLKKARWYLDREIARREGA